MRQRPRHDVLGVDQQVAHRLARASELGLYGKLCDETVDAVWEEPLDRH